MKINLNFIPQNTALKGVKNIGLYDSNGNKLKNIPLGNLAPKSKGNKLYTFGALSDVHLPYDTAREDFIRALNYLNNDEKVDFICISGDMSANGTAGEWQDFKNHVDTYSPNTPVYLSTGNHDAITTTLTYEYPRQYTGNPLYYSFTQGNDVFIIFGVQQPTGVPFSQEALQWLYETLEENRSKRCFVFQHFMRMDSCGNAHEKYSWDALNNTNGKVFISLMEHYKNVLWFHGHSHTKFELQSILPSKIANYDRLFGCHSIHVPSLAVPSDATQTYAYAESQGYIVDVYKDGIHLRGRDFVEEKFLPIASYWIDTTPTKIEAGTYSDSYGIIDTPNSSPSVSYTNLLPSATDVDGSVLTGPNGEKGYMPNHRLNSKGLMVAQDGLYATGFIPVDSDDIVRIKNAEPYGGAASVDSSNNRIAFYDQNKVYIYQTTFLFDNTGLQDEGNGVRAFKYSNWNTGECSFIRISGVFNENTIITVNTLHVV